MIDLRTVKTPRCAHQVHATVLVSKCLNPATVCGYELLSLPVFQLRAWTSSSSSSLAISSSSLTASAASSASSVVPGIAASSASAASAPSKPSAPTPSPSASAPPCAKLQNRHYSKSMMCSAFNIR